MAAADNAAMKYSCNRKLGPTIESKHNEKQCPTTALNPTPGSAAALRWQAGDSAAYAEPLGRRENDLRMYFLQSVCRSY